MVREATAESSAFHKSHRCLCRLHVAGERGACAGRPAVALLGVMIHAACRDTGLGIDMCHGVMADTGGAFDVSRFVALDPGLPGTIVTTLVSTTSAAT